MTRRLASVAVGVVLAALAACGGSGEPSGGAGESPGTSDAGVYGLRVVECSNAPKADYDDMDCNGDGDRGRPVELVWAVGEERTFDHQGDGEVVDAASGTMRFEVELVGVEVEVGGCDGRTAATAVLRLSVENVGTGWGQPPQVVRYWLGDDDRRVDVAACPARGLGPLLEPGQRAEVIERVPLPERSGSLVAETVLPVTDSLVPVPSE